MSKTFEVEKVTGYVWCDHHGCVHEECSNPYDNAHGHDDDGNCDLEVYDEDHNVVNAMERPECGPESWRSLYHGEEGTYDQ